AKYIRILAIVVMLIGLAVISGWLFGFKPLLSFIEGSSTMKFNTALSFLLSGFSLYTSSRHDTLSNKFTAILAALIFVISSLTLSQFLLGVDLRIDNFFIQDHISQYTPGRMSPATGAAFCLFAIALIFSLSKKPIFKNLTQLVLWVMAIIALISCI